MSAAALQHMHDQAREIDRLRDALNLLSGPWERVYIGTPHYRKTITLTPEEYDELRALIGV